MDGARAIAERSPRHAARSEPAAQAACATSPQVHGDGSVDADGRVAALDAMGVDHEGLDRLDREILTVICDRFGGGPVGLSTLAVAVHEEQDTIEDVYEPYLLQRGFIHRTPRGRLRDPARLPPHRASSPPSELPRASSKPNGP